MWQHRPTQLARVEIVHCSHSCGSYQFPSEWLVTRPVSSLALPLLLEEDNEGDGELCNATNTPLLDRCIGLRLCY